MITWILLILGRLQPTLRIIDGSSGHAYFRMPVHVLPNGGKATWHQRRIRIEQENQFTGAVFQGQVIGAAKPKILRGCDQMYLREMLLYKGNTVIVGVIVNDDDFTYIGSLGFQ